MITTKIDIPAHLITDFDVYDPSLAAPTDVFQERVAALRKQGPILYSPHHGGHWVVTRYKEALQVLQDPETFSSFPNNLLNAAQGRFLPLELDPPEHSYYRQALQPLFSPKQMKALEPEIRGIITELIDQFANVGECEFISEFAHELPTRIFLALMGWPLSDAPKFTEWTDITLQGIPGASEEVSAEARAKAAAEIYEYFGRVIARVRSGEDNAEGLTAQIINTPLAVEGKPRQLTDEELCRMFFLLLVAGLHTVQGALAWGLLHLSRNLEQREAIIDDPTLIPSAVEEILRIETATSSGRRATRDIEIGDVTIKAGDQLLVVMTAANRDEDEFDDADRLQIERHPNRHIGFGAGPHRCLGSHLARLELRLALEEIHNRIPDYALVEDNPPVFHSSQVRGCAKLPITFTPPRR
ncbi:cytochrome P450 [Rhodococcus sp. NPDC057014]|uniref:cytochrome P450 n=1 Tax=Rhodococcus sp. NPDC057014 TaxID=3346000 RepID=UPI0036314199